MFVRYKQINIGSLHGFFIVLEENSIESINVLAGHLNAPYYKVKKVLKEAGGKIDCFYDNDFCYFSTKEQAEAALIALRLVNSK